MPDSAAAAVLPRRRARFGARLLATFGGIGYFPLGPGTLASIAALAIVRGFRVFVHAHAPSFLFWGIALTLPAIGAAHEVARERGEKDPSVVVVDEVVGQWIALSGAPTLRDWHVWVIAFLLFRFFDIVKPFPIRRIEKLPGGVGIVLDDVMAGVYSAVVLMILGWYKLY